MVTPLKRIFKKDPETLSFKQCNYLNSLPPAELESLLSISEQGLMNEELALCERKKVLLLGFSPQNFLVQKILDSKPEWLVLYFSEEDSFGEELSRPQLIPVLGGIKPLSLATGSFDMALLPQAACLQRNSIPLFPEISRILTLGGKVVMTSLHPSLEILLFNQNPASQRRAQTSLSGYHSSLTDHHLYIEAVRESLVDKQTRSFFIGPDGDDASDEYWGIPLVLLLRAVKFVRGSGNGF